MKSLQGRVAIVTGAGRGLGRSHALELAAQGASIVVNDIGCLTNGDLTQDDPAADVIKEIEALGGNAIASGHDISDWKQAEQLIKQAVDTFGDLHILVNNAGILRDKSFANMSELEWDAVINVHLKGHAATTQHAVSYWKNKSKSGDKVDAVMLGTTSVAGIFSNFGQANYCSAKAAIIALCKVTALEGARYGIRSNAIAPSAKTRMFDDMKSEMSAETLTALEPKNVSDLIVWLSRPGACESGQVFHVMGNKLMVFEDPKPVIELDFNLLSAGKKDYTLLDGKLPSLKDANQYMMSVWGDL